MPCPVELRSKSAKMSPRLRFALANGVLSHSTGSLEYKNAPTSVSCRALESDLQVKVLISIEMRDGAGGVALIFSAQNLRAVKVAAVARPVMPVRGSRPSHRARGSAAGCAASPIPPAPKPARHHRSIPRSAPAPDARAQTRGRDCESAPAFPPRSAAGPRSGCRARAVVGWSSAGRRPRPDRFSVAWKSCA